MLISRGRVATAMATGLSVCTWGRSSDLSSTLAELGVQSQTSLRLRNKQASAGQTPRVPCLDHSHIDTVYNC